MITDTDIKKLKGVFATKADVKKFATKIEFSELKADVKKLDARVEKLDARVEKLDARTIRIVEKVSDMDTRMDSFATKEDLENGLRATTDVLLTAMDKVARGMDVLKSEYTAVGLQLDRHVNDRSVYIDPIHS